MTPNNNISYNSNGSEDTVPKLLKITGSDRPTIVLGPLIMEPPRISA